MERDLWAWRSPIVEARIFRCTYCKKNARLHARRSALPTHTTDSNNEVILARRIDGNVGWATPMMPGVGLQIRQTHQERIPWGLTRGIYELSFRVKTYIDLPKCRESRSYSWTGEKITTTPEYAPLGTSRGCTSSWIKTLPKIRELCIASRDEHNVQRIVIIMKEHFCKTFFWRGSLSIVASILAHGLNTMEAVTVLLIKIARKKNKKQVMCGKSYLSNTIKATHAFDFAKKTCYDTLWYPLQNFNRKSW